MTCLVKPGNILAVCVRMTAVALSLFLTAAFARSPPPAEAFAALPAIGSPVLSPDGRHLAMLRVADGGYVPVIWRLNEAGFEEIHIGLRREVVAVIAVEWSGPDFLLISALGMRPRASMPDSRVYVYSLARGTVRPLLRRSSAGGRSLRARRVNRERQASMVLIDALPHRPGEVLARIAFPDRPHDMIERIDLRSRARTPELAQVATERGFIADPAGRVRVMQIVTEGGPRFAFRLADSDDWQTLGLALLPDEGDQIMALARHQDAVWVLRPAQARRELELRDLQTGRVDKRLPLPNEHDVSGILFEDHDGAWRPIGFQLVDDMPRHVYFDPDWTAIQARIDAMLPETVNQIISSTSEVDRHVVRSAHPARPPVFYLYDDYLYDDQLDRSPSLRRLGGTYPGLESASLVAKKPVHYPARDGTPIPAFLTVPESGEGPWPAIVLPHGGPHSHTDGDFSYWTQFLVSQGYLVIEPNFRGSTGYGQEWMAAGRLEWGGLMQDDIDDAAAWLLAQGLSSPGEVCIMGGSFGGYAALMGVARPDHSYACAIAISPATDLVRLVRDDQRNAPIAPWTRFIGSKGQGEARLRSVSPFHLAARIDVPVLLLHARDDLRVPSEHSLSMAQALREAGRPVRYVELPDGGHAIVDESSRQMLLDETAAFLADQIGGRAEPPGAVGQTPK
ncbi:MAG: alpha/beta hydrolase family protein [Wenzhouxiangella sp.]